MNLHYQFSAIHSSHTIIGVDLGGTKTALARFSQDSLGMEEELRIATHAGQSFKHVFENLVEAIQKLSNDTTKACGIGVPGLVTQPEGVIVTLPNIPGAEGFSLKKSLSEHLGLPVEVDNDANCFTIAEAFRGAGKGHSVVVGVTLGTGVGGGIVIDGKIYHGTKGYAGEIGHMLLYPGEPLFRTDNNRGDVEQFLSGRALGNRCAAANDPSDYLKGETCSFMHDDVEREIAWICVNLTHLLDPGIIVFGGSAGRALESRLEGIREKLGRWLLPGTPKPQLAVAKLKNSATLGAALLIKYRNTHYG